MGTPRVVVEGAAVDTYFLGVEGRGKFEVRVASYARGAAVGVHVGPPQVVTGQDQADTDSDTDTDTDSIGEFFKWKY